MSAKNLADLDFAASVEAAEMLLLADQPFQRRNFRYCAKHPSLHPPRLGWMPSIIQTWGEQKLSCTEFAYGSTSDHDAEQRHSTMKDIIIFRA